MKKQFQKPENWQDFETLCKKLWGEAWQIPLKIKKNGRNGQPQAGVDIYGIPKGETEYWGIQCKGKDDYVNAKLTKKEIDNEIEKAKKFKPALAVFIFATTMNKDSEIEEYVRIKNLESTQTGFFEVELYCWEDIADLIEENRDTFNFYVNNQQYKTKFDLKVYLNELQKNELVIKPKCVRKIKRYRVKKKLEPSRKIDISRFDIGAMNNSWMIGLGETKINEAICSFELIMANEGTSVIEDWRVKFHFNGEHKEILDQLGTGPMGMIDLTILKHKRTYVDDDKISYSPKDNEPLIQKDNRYFEAFIIPVCKEYTIPIQWEILARDYNATGEIFLKVEPDYEDKIIFEDVETEEELKEDEIISIIEKKNYNDEKKVIE